MSANDMHCTGNVHISDVLRVGHVLKAHGVKGVLKVAPLTDDVSRFKRIKELYIEHAGTTRGKASSERGEALVKRAITDVKPDREFLHVKLEGVDTRDAADALRGAYLCVKREDAIKLPEGRHFICDLIGCEIQTPDGTRIGVLREILQHGAADVYVVEREGSSMMFPALKKVLLDVNSSQKRITVCPDELARVAIYEGDV